jgi:D-inositol-3-phosphate glycosyltransferase
MKVVLYLRRHSKEFDIIAIHFPLMLIFLSILRRSDRNKMVYTSHTNYWSLNPSRITLVEKLILFLESWGMKRVGKVIAQTEQIKTQYMTFGINSSSIEIIPNAIDTKIFNPKSEIDGFVLDNGLVGRFSILYVGRMSKIKGVEYLIRALNILVNEWGYKQVFLLLVGQPSAASIGSDKPLDIQKANAFIKDNGLKENVMFTGYVSRERLLKFYSACDVFVLPSLVELFGLVITEAMALGKPVIGTKVGGIPSQIIDDWNGFLVDPANERALAEKIRILIDNPEKCKTMGANSRQYATDYFDWLRVADRISFVYERLSNKPILRSAGI